MAFVISKRSSILLLINYLGLASSTNVSATINSQPVRIGPIAGGTRTFCSSGGTGSQPLTVRYDWRMISESY